jgi:hypothetical protein
MSIRAVTMARLTLSTDFRSLSPPQNRWLDADLEYARTRLAL